jgi:hypothetical protein
MNDFYPLESIQLDNIVPQKIIARLMGTVKNICYLFAFLNRWNFYDIHLKSNIFGKLR